MPYSCGKAGAGLDIDWKKTIIRRSFTTDVVKNQFSLNTVEQEFFKEILSYNFSVEEHQEKFDKKVIQLTFDVTCQGV